MTNQTLTCACDWTCLLVTFPLVNESLTGVTAVRCLLRDTIHALDVTGLFTTAATLCTLQRRNEFNELTGTISNRLNRLFGHIYSPALLLTNTLRQVNTYDNCIIYKKYHKFYARPPFPW